MMIVNKNSNHFYVSVVKIVEKKDGAKKSRGPNEISNLIN